MKPFLLLMSVIYAYHFVYQWDDIQRVDRDNALIIASERFERGINPYDTLTSIGNPLTTGTTSVLYATILSERHLSFLFWLWLITIFYNGIHFTAYSLFFMFSLIFFQRTIMYRLDELYYGMIPMYYAFKNKNGWLMSLALMNRIAYFPFGILLGVMDRKTILQMMTCWAVLSLVIEPYAMIENNIVMMHVPKYPLDYSLLVIIPVMLYFNNLKIIQR